MAAYRRDGYDSRYALPQKLLWGTYATILNHLFLDPYYLRKLAS